MVLPLFKEFTMKKIYIFIILIFVLFKSQTILGQYLQLTYPIFQAVYQRDVSNNAVIPVSGQVFGFPNGSPGTYKIECITNQLNTVGSVISGTTSTTLITNNTLKGYFNGSITRSKGWYSLQVKYTFNVTGYTSSTNTKFGVGDVFIIAGQSNGQGFNGNDFTYPNPTSPVNFPVPEWVVGNNVNWFCTKEFQNSPSSMGKISGSNVIGPTGNNSWCYGVLGQRISAANGGMPVAFFNTSAGGSTVKNWADGADGNTTGNSYFAGEPQWCSGNGQTDTYYKGQPYTSLKLTLNWYTQLFGVRAILWHQGETDAENFNNNFGTIGYNPNPIRNYVATSSQNYTNLLNNVISKSRDHLNDSNLSWVIANVSFIASNTSGGTSMPDTRATLVRSGQTNTVNSTAFKFQGPLTDSYTIPSSTVINSTQSYRPDNTHFSELYTANGVGGLTFLAQKWNEFIDPSTLSITSFKRILPKSVPPILITQSGSTTIFSITPVSNADYCWTSGNTLAPPQSATVANCLSIGTSVTSSSSVRCFIGIKNLLPSPRDAVNWFSTGVATPQNCPGCRESVEEPDETYGGINMKIYPNPTDKDFRVEFDVLEDDTHVKLEFFDVAGRSVKVIAGGSHAKGHFNYPITETLPTGLIICQLKVGDIYITHKISKIN